MHATGLDEAYAAVSAAARRHGRRVTGTEVIGLLPEWVLVEAGQRLAGEPLAADEAVAVAVERLGLNTMQTEGRRFVPDEKIVELVLAAKIKLD